jgi:hypothetical protein
VDRAYQSERLTLARVATDTSALCASLVSGMQTQDCSAACSSDFFHTRERRSARVFT